MYEVTKYSDAVIDEKYRELTSQGVRFALACYVDIHGVPKAKATPIGHLRDMARGSELFTGYALDGLGQRPNDDEIASVPDLERGIIIPWQKDTVWFPADNYFRGEPYPLNTRVALQSVLDEAKKQGYTFNLGIEAEVYLLKLDESGKLVNPNSNDNLEKSCYDVQRLFEAYEFATRMTSTMNDLGWDVYSFDHEDGQSQFEFDFKYSDALTTCDRYIFFRHMAKKIAADLGLIAVFMAKPFSNLTGNGAHLNISLADADSGKNLFIPASPDEDIHDCRLSRLGYSFIGGLIRHGLANAAAFAPTVNSYKRLIRKGAMSYYSWAPVFNCYGGNNRSNNLRVPMGGGRVECRGADSTCNPYLAATLALASGLEGIAEKIDPGPPHHENMYEYSDAELAERGISMLPRNLMEAVHQFGADPFVTKTLGQELRDEFVRYKEAEWEDYHQSISQWEVERYARAF
jgi:glutamine synthetase